MAKGKSSRSGTRDAPQSLPSVRSRPSQAIAGRHLWKEVQDLRHKLERPSVAKLFSGAVARLDVDRTPRQGTRAIAPRVPTPQIAFTAPRQTLVCVRRAVRKQVLHAFKKTGKRGQRKPRRSEWSSYKCGKR